MMIIYLQKLTAVPPVSSSANPPNETRTRALLLNLWVLNLLICMYIVVAAVDDDVVVMLWNESEEKREREGERKRGNSGWVQTEPNDL